MHNKAMTPKWNESMATPFQSCPQPIFLYLIHFSPIPTGWIYRLHRALFYLPWGLWAMFLDFTLTM